MAHQAWFKSILNVNVAGHSDSCLLAQWEMKTEVLGHEGSRPAPATECSKHRRVYLQKNKQNKTYGTTAKIEHDCVSSVARGLSWAPALNLNFAKGTWASSYGTFLVWVFPNSVSVAREKTVLAGFSVILAVLQCLLRTHMSRQY